MRWLISWTLYWLGDLVSKPMSRWDWHLYPLYNWLMQKANDVQGHGPGPWGPPEDWEDVKRDLDL